MCVVNPVMYPHPMTCRWVSHPGLGGSFVSNRDMYPHPGLPGGFRFFGGGGDRVHLGGALC